MTQDQGKTGQINLPVLELEDYVVPVADSDRVVNDISGSIEYAFVGSGQGGCRIAEAFYRLGYKKTICLNTSSQDLKSVSLPDNQKLLLNIGEGGAGKDMGRGDEAVVKYRQEIYDLMRRVFGSVEHVMLCIGSGGGSGGGSAVGLRAIAQQYLKYNGFVTDLNQRVGYVLAIPTNGELLSPRVAENSLSLLNGLSDLAENGMVSPLVVIDNDRIKKLYPRLPVAKFWPTVNTNVAQLFNVFNVLSLQHSPYTSFDPTDYKTVISCGGHLVFGVTKVELTDQVDETVVSEALRSNLTRTLLADGFDLTTARSMACVVVGGQRMFEEIEGLQEAIDYAFDSLANFCSGAVCHRGVYQDDREVLRAYTIIGGLRRPASRYKQIEELAKRSYP